MKKLPIIILTLLISFTSCEKDPVVVPTTHTADYFVFGRYYGFCAGESCVEIFKVENKQVYEDSTDKYPNHDKAYEGKYWKLDAARYLLIKDLESKLPIQLYSEKQTVIGSPDAGDWGGLYVEIKTATTHRFWIIDNLNSNLPEYLRPFGRAIGAAVDTLQ